MKLKEQISLIILGFLAPVENFVVLLAAIWNTCKSHQENTHYNLVISLWVCDFILGSGVIMFGNVIVPNNDANNEDIYTVFDVYFYVNSATYHNINCILGNTIYAVMFGSVQALTLGLKSILYVVIHLPKSS